MTITIGYLVRITDVDEIHFGTYGFQVTIEEDDDVCIYTNDPSGDYLVTATGDGVGSAFEISNGGATPAYVDYKVSWEDDSGTDTLISGTQSGTQEGANTSSETCSGGTNATVSITMTRADITSVIAGTYTGVLTLLIEPTS